VSAGHRKEHHTHETTDAYAEGWDARARALPNETVLNPYRAEIAEIKELELKRSQRQVEGRLRNVELWDQGWMDYEDDEANPP
jgi:hypothetical protein